MISSFVVASSQILYRGLPVAELPLKRREEVQRVAGAAGLRDFPSFSPKIGGSDNSYAGSAASPLHVQLERKYTRSQKSISPTCFRSESK